MQQSCMVRNSATSGFFESGNYGSYCLYLCLLDEVLIYLSRKQEHDVATDHKSDDELASSLLSPIPKENGPTTVQRENHRKK